MIPFAALKAMPWKLIGFAALGLFVVGLMLALNIERVQNGKLKAQIEQCTEARAADRRSYEGAQKLAAAQNQADVARIEKDQDHVTQEVERNLNARLAELRRQLVHSGQAAAIGGPRGQSPTGADGKSGAGIAEAAGLCLATSELLSAAESEERHDRLIDWVEQQLRIQR